MSPLDFLLAGYNLPFLLALGLALVLAALQIFGGDTEGDADVDADADVDVDADADVDAAVGGNVGLVGGFLGFLGIGKVPLTIVLLVLFASFGLAGLVGNGALIDSFGTYPDHAFFAVLAGSGLVALLGTSIIGRGIARLAPRTSTAIRQEDLVGSIGTVVTPTVSPTYGRVQVRDKHGSLHTVYAVVEEDDPLPSQTDVALVSYDPQQRRFLVRALDRYR